MSVLTRAPALLAIVAVALSCHDSEAPTAQAATYQGFFRAGFEVEAFVPCGSTEQWWVLPPADLSQRYAQLGLAEYEPAFVAVDGILSAPGTYGHLGAYNRELEVTKVVAVHVPTPGDCP